MYQNITYHLTSPSLHWPLLGPNAEDENTFDLNETLTLPFSTESKLWSSVCETSLNSQRENIFYFKLKRRFSSGLKLQWVTFWCILQSRMMKEGSF